MDPFASILNTNPENSSLQRPLVSASWIRIGRWFQQKRRVASTLVVDGAAKNWRLIAFFVRSYIKGLAFSSSSMSPLSSLARDSPTRLSRVCLYISVMTMLSFVTISSPVWIIAKISNKGFVNPFKSLSHSDWPGHGNAFNLKVFFNIRKKIKRARPSLSNLFMNVIMGVLRILHTSISFFVWVSTPLRCPPSVRCPIAV